MRRGPLWVAFAATAALLGLAPSAQAGWPGANGRLVSADAVTNKLRTFQINGSDLRSLPIAAAGSSAPGVAGRPRWSPDGTKIVFSYRASGSALGCLFTTRKDPTYLRVINADGTGLRDLTRPSCPNRWPQEDLTPSWSPDSQRVLFRRQRIRGFEGTDSALLSISVAGGGIQTVRAGSFASDAVYSPDGQRIAFMRDDDLYVMPATGTGETRLTASPGITDHSPDWSPDGTRLAFSSNRDTGGVSPEIYTMNANGTGPVRLTFRTGENDVHPAWSPDGRRIAWAGGTTVDDPAASNGAPTTDVFVMNADGSEQTNITNAARGDVPDASRFQGPDWQRLAIAPVLPAPAMRGFAFDRELSGGESATATVHIGERAPAGGRTVSVSTTSPYLAIPPNVVIAAGAQSATFTVSATAPPASQEAVVRLAIAGREATVRFTIVKPAGLNRLFAFTEWPTVLGGTTVQAAAVLDGPAGTPGVTVALRSSDPSLAQVPATASQSGASTQANFDITTAPVTAPTTVTIFATMDGREVQTTLTLRPPREPTTLSISPSSVATDAEATGTFAVPTLPAGETSSPVTVTSSNPAAYPDRSETAAGPGTTARTFRIFTRPVATPTVVEFTITHEGISRSASLTVTPRAAPPPEPSLQSLTFSPSSVTGGTSSTGTVTISAPAPAGGRTVNLTSSNTGVATVPVSVLIPAGATRQTFTATTRAVTASTPVDVTAIAFGSASVTGRLTVTPPSTTTADRVSIVLAEYESGRRELRVEATSTNAAATLRVFATGSTTAIGTLNNEGGGRYRGTFANVAALTSITVKSSAGGEATRTVTQR